MKLLRNPIVTGILAVLAVAVVFFQFGGAKLFRSKPATAAVVANSPIIPPAAASQPVPPSSALNKTPASVESSPLTNRAVDRDYIASHFNAWVAEGRLRDPFLLIQPDEGRNSGTETNSPVASWKLKAIWNQTDSRLAVINNGVYRVGDEIQGYKILRIENDEVWFQGPGRRERLGFEAPPKIPAGKNTADGVKSGANELPKDNLKT